MTSPAGPSSPAGFVQNNGTHQMALDLTHLQFFSSRCGLDMPSSHTKGVFATLVFPQDADSEWQWQMAKKETPVFHRQFCRVANIPEDGEDRQGRRCKRF